MGSRNKYNRTKVTWKGRSFDSKLEAAVAVILQDMENKGDISDLQYQAEVKLTRAGITYKPDFRFMRDGVQWFAEAKGFDSPTWPIKKRLWKHYGPAPLEIWKGTYQRPVLKEVVNPVCK